MKIKRVTVLNVSPDVGIGKSIIKIECENISPYTREVGIVRKNLVIEIPTPYLQGVAYAESELGLKVEEIEDC